MKRHNSLYVVDVQSGHKELIVVSYLPENPVFLLISENDQEIRINGLDIYEAFNSYRIRLEHESKFIMCNGSRFDTFPSGNLRGMSNGTKTYLLEFGKKPSRILNLLDESTENIATQKKQFEFYKNWLKSFQTK
jgi:hypothetical protein